MTHTQVRRALKALAIATVGVMLAALLVLAQGATAHAATVDDTQGGITFRVNDADIAAGATVRSRQSAAAAMKDSPFPHSATRTSAKPAT